MARLFPHPRLHVPLLVAVFHLQARDSQGSSGQTRHSLRFPLRLPFLCPAGSSGPGDILLQVPGLLAANFISPLRMLCLGLDLAQVPKAEHSTRGCEVGLELWENVPESQLQVACDTTAL